MTNHAPGFSFKNKQHPSCRFFYAVKFIHKPRSSLRQPSRNSLFIQSLFNHGTPVALYRASLPGKGLRKFTRNYHHGSMTELQSYWFYPPPYPPFTGGHTPFHRWPRWKGDFFFKGRRTTRRSLIHTIRQKSKIAQNEQVGQNEPLILTSFHIWQQTRKEITR